MSAFQQCPKNLPGPLIKSIAKFRLEFIEKSQSRKLKHSSTLSEKQLANLIFIFFLSFCRKINLFLIHS